ncbi:MAG: acyltransferase family protein [Sphingobacteriales bacterium]|jgi:1-acyl-sn-glycerol-3-phosphate acyltransferase|nr:acyltransferase family protein [Sphingobacteriales bacterium]MBP9141956.1 acyltransferase family protein [Chitinophagales bacterium]MDA0198864.1 lysophospholipid acyltransferase family protein [Bacteroidota bacterium]MBK6890205.1 acyltransferase family protein [Sphingobacteriales bacterium]MBK7527268.1 acyltransferase family protein [Sphingobacteriales bacterium]
MTDQERFYTPPSAELLHQLTKPLRAWFSPQYFGLENLDAAHPVMVVANHTIYGAFDFSLYFTKLYRKKGIVLRALGDHFHYQIPGWRNIVQQLGVVRGTPENCAELMQEGAFILVYPGGSREVFKRKGEQHQVIWKQRTGFVKLAIKYGYDIVPLAAYGPDFAYEIIKDSNDILNSFWGRLLNFSGLLNGPLKNGERLPPVVKGVGNTIIPRPEKFYFSFGQPITTSLYQNKNNNKEELSDEILFELRQQIIDSIETQMEILKQIRENDQQQVWWRKVLKKINS